MPLPFGFGTLDWGDWFMGLIAGFLSGGATALTACGVLTIADPDALSPNHAKAMLATAGGVFLVAGVAGMVNFVRQNPLPKPKQTEFHQQSVKTDAAGAVTQKETSIKITEPAPVPTANPEPSSDARNKGLE